MPVKRVITIFTLLASLVLAAILVSIIAVGSVTAQQNSTGAGSTLHTSSNNTAGNTTGGINVSIVPGASSLGDKAFSPNPINVKAGGAVTWTNDDTIVHTATSGTAPSDPSKGKEFDSGLSTPGKTFSHLFNTIGVFPYFCQIHPTMIGKVVVVS